MNHMIAGLFFAVGFAICALVEGFGQAREHCIQEVHQGYTLSRELGSIYRDERTGYLVCSRTI